MSNMTLSRTLSPVMNFCPLHHMICQCKVTSHSVPAFKRHVVVSIVSRPSKTSVYKIYTLNQTTIIPCAFHIEG